ncbi:MAG: hypothetical protein ABIO39_05715 [Caulobacteraceae bacterium]
MTDHSTLETTDLGAGRVRLEIETSATTAALITDLVAATDSNDQAGGVREIGHSSGPPAD